VLVYEILQEEPNGGWRSNLFYQFSPERPRDVPGREIIFDVKDPVRRFPSLLRDFVESHQRVFPIVQNNVSMSIGMFLRDPGLLNCSKLRGLKHSVHLNLSGTIQIPRYTENREESNPQHWNNQIPLRATDLSGIRCPS
jgi:hypothetical protein